VESAKRLRLVPDAGGERRKIEYVFNKMKEEIRKIKIYIDNHQKPATIAQEYSFWIFISTRR
jgi:hypothetical protein